MVKVLLVPFILSFVWLFVLGGRRRDPTCWQFQEGFDFSRSVPDESGDFFDLFDGSGCESEDKCVEKDGRLSLDELRILAKAVLPPSTLYDIESMTEHLKGESGEISVSKSDFEDKVWPFFNAGNPSLLVIDVQNDFVSGSLAVPLAESVIGPVNELVDYDGFHARAYSLDWHPKNHISFFNNWELRKEHIQELREGEISPNDIKLYSAVTFDGLWDEPVSQILWPEHCVQNSYGAEFDRRLRVQNGSIIIKKGQRPNLDSYSAFYDNLKVDDVGTSLSGQLKDLKVRVLVIVGLAMDYCVGFSALDALDSGMAVIVIREAVGEIAEDTAKSMLKRIVDRGGIVLQNVEDSKNLLDCFAASGGSSLFNLSIIVSLGLVLLALPLGIFLRK